MWKYKWRLLVEQCFLLSASAMGLYLSYQWSFWFDLYLGMLIVWYSLRGRGSLVPAALGGLTCLALQHTVSLASVLYVVTTPMIAFVIVELLLKQTGPFLPLLCGRQITFFSFLILLFGSLQQSVLCLVVQSVFNWHLVASQLMGGLLCLSFFSHWDSYIPQKNKILSKHLLPIGYLVGVFFICMAALAAQNTLWFVGVLSGLVGTLVLGQCFFSLLVMLAALMLVQITLGLIPSIVQWQLVFVGVSWILIVFQLVNSNKRYQRESLLLSR